MNRKPVSPVTVKAMLKAVRISLGYALNVRITLLEISVSNVKMDFYLCFFLMAPSCVDHVPARYHWSLTTLQITVIREVIF